METAKIWFILLILIPGKGEIQIQKHSYMTSKLMKHIEPGVLTGNDVQEVFRIAKENQFALPAINVTGTNTINSVLEAARDF